MNICLFNNGIILCCYSVESVDNFFPPETSPKLSTKGKSFPKVIHRRQCGVKNLLSKHRGIFPKNYPQVVEMFFEQCPKFLLLCKTGGKRRVRLLEKNESSPLVETMPVLSPRFTLENGEFSTRFPPYMQSFLLILSRNKIRERQI